LFTCVNPDKLPLPLVNAAGLLAQLGLTSVARFVTPVTVIVQEAVPFVMATPVNAIVSGVPCTTLLDPEQPDPNATVGVALVKRSDAGNESVNAMPPWAGLVPPLVNVKINVVDAPSLMAPAPKALLSVGVTTVNVALAAVLESAVGPVAVTVLVVLVLLAVALTNCVMVQVWPGGSDPPVKPTVVPAFAPPDNVALAAPVQATLPDAAFTNVPVYVSLMTTPVTEPGLEALLVTAIVMVEVWPTPIVVGENDFVAVGGA
jgi:hypothetical protein